MNFHFNYSRPMDDEFGMIFGVVYMVVLFFSLLLSLTLFVLRAFSLYTIAKRRGLRNPWLVWIPVANRWMIGSFSDQYRYLVKGEIKNKRKYLLGFAVGNVTLGMIAAIVCAVLAGRLIVSDGSLSDGQMAAMVMGPAISVLTVSAVLAVTKLVEYVLRQVCMYDLYRTCDPGNAVAYLVLGILFSVLEPIFLICIRKKDGGLPPRRETPRYYEE